MIIEKFKFFLGALLILFLFAVILFPLHAIADSCPCCGQSYGAAAPGDEARVNALRAEHEASCCPSSGGSSGGSSGSYQQPSIDWGKKDVESKGLEQERQSKEAEEEVKRREEEANEKFEKSKQEALELMKGTGSDTLTIKSGTEVNFFGIKGTPGTPEGIKIKSGMPEEATNKAVMAWACATWIADFVFPAARKGDVSEVRFLEEQVRKTLSGEKPGVDCPNLSPPPDVQGFAIGPDSPGIKFYGALIKAVSVQTEQIVQANQEIANLLGKKQVTDDDIQRLEQELKAKTVEAETKKSKEKTKKPGEKVKEEVKPPATEAKKEDEDPMAKALAALKKAQEAKKKIDEYEEMEEKVRTNPSLAEEFFVLI